MLIAGVDNPIEAGRIPLESVTLPSGGVIDFEYDAADNQTAIKDGAGNVIESRTYHQDGTLASKQDRFGTVQYLFSHVPGVDFARTGRCCRCRSTCNSSTTA